MLTLKPVISPRACLLQTMEIEDEHKYEFDPLDCTKVWPSGNNFLTCSAFLVLKCVQQSTVTHSCPGLWLHLFGITVFYLV